MLVTLNDVLKPAQEGRYAVGLFNTTDTDMLEGVISAAEELRSPVIIGTAEVLLPYGSLELIAPAMVAAAKRATVPVVVHFDHGLTFDKCMQALQLGFSSVMFDGSAGDAQQNISDTARIVKIAHAFGATVEGEIGHVGQADQDDGEDSSQYTTPEEAVAFVEATGVDALAVAIGTAHGAYKAKPKLDLQRLAQIRSALSTPLVLHGGSGLSDDDFHNAIYEGVTKVNIFTDLCAAGMNASEKAAAEGYDPSRHMNAYLAMRTLRMEAIREATKKKMQLFGCVGKA